MKRKLIDNRRKVEAKKRKRKPYGVLRVYNPKDITVTIGGVEIKNWENFEVNTWENTAPTSPDEILEDLDRELKMLKEI